MALIPPETIDQIRAKLDIVELVGEYVPQLQRAGRNMKGRCPFHQERTPSFVVSPERQTFHCFGCGVGGDAFSFLMKIENLNFGEAAEKLAQKTGITIVASNEPVGPEQRERIKLRELLEFAALFYHEVLLKSPEGEPARRYLSERKLSRESVTGFQLGYAPRSGKLLEAASKKGFSLDQLVKAGLAAAPREAGQRARDYFFDRVLFPIRDAKGVVVGFGGRTLGDGVPKYLNSPDTGIFSKGRLLYGLDRGLGEARKQRRLILMEGYMDVIASHQHGVTTACAPLGTAVTPDQVILVKRYATEVTIVFDADSAGLNAAVRGAELLLAGGLAVRIATVPSGKDPDEFLHAQGAPAFKSGVLEKAVDLVEFKTDLLIAAQKGPLSPSAKSEIAKLVLATIDQCPDEVLKSEWTRRLAHKLLVPEDAIRRQLDKMPQPKHRHAPEKNAPVASAPLSSADRQIFCLLIKQPALCGELNEGDFETAGSRVLWRALKALEPWGDSWAARWLESLADADRAAASSLLLLAGELESEDAEKNLREAIARRRGAARLDELKRLLQAGELTDAALKDEFYKLSVELKGSKR